MSALITTALIYSATPSAVATIAATGATIWEPPPAVRSALLHLAAGVVFAVVAAELLPQIMKEEGALPWTVAGFIPGVLIMLLVRWLNHQADSKASEGNQWPMALLAGDTIDQTVGGVLLGVSLTTGTTIGALLSLSMGVEDVSFGVAITLTLANVGAGRWQMIGTAAALGAVMVIAALIAAQFLNGLPTSIIIFLLALGSAALLFVVTEQLLVEAHTVPQAPLLASVFFVGFLAILVLTMLTGQQA